MKRCALSSYTLPWNVSNPKESAVIVNPIWFCFDETTDYKKQIENFIEGFVNEIVLNEFKQYNFTKYNDKISKLPTITAEEDYTLIDGLFLSYPNNTDFTIATPLDNSSVKFNYFDNNVFYVNVKYGEKNGLPLPFLSVLKEKPKNYKNLIVFVKSHFIDYAKRIALGIIATGVDMKKINSKAELMVMYRENVMRSKLSVGEDMIKKGVYEENVFYSLVRVLHPKKKRFIKQLEKEVGNNPFSSFAYPDSIMFDFVVVCRDIPEGFNKLISSYIDYLTNPKCKDLRDFISYYNAGKIPNKEKKQ